MSASPPPPRGKPAAVRRGPALQRELRCSNPPCAAVRAAGEAAGTSAARTGVAVIDARRAGAVRCPNCGRSLRGEV